MLLGQEAVCLTLYFAKDKRISSKTKLNKLLAKLDQFFIPSKIDFKLNRFGSQAINLPDSNGFFNIRKYEKGTAYELTGKGALLVEEKVLPYLKETTNEEELKDLQEEIRTGSELSADEISRMEHESLKLDVEDRDFLRQVANEIHIDFLDLKEEKTSNTYKGLMLAGLVDYCFHLSKYLKNKFEKKEGYGFDDNMLDYYFLAAMKRILPKIKEYQKTNNFSENQVERYYNYFTETAKKKEYPFSLDNKDLRKLVA